MQKKISNFEIPLPAYNAIPHRVPFGQYSTERGSIIVNCFFMKNFI